MKLIFNKNSKGEQKSKYNFISFDIRFYTKILLYKKFYEAVKIKKSLW